MKSALVLTVGTGTRPDTNIVQPLVKTVRNSRPDRAVFLATRESAQYAAQIRAICDLGDHATEVRIEKEDDLVYVFRQALAALRELRKEGYAPEEIHADYTSGTKAMTAGLALAAVAFDCGTLRYVTGQREHGVVISGTEQFLAIPPAGVLALQRIRQALGLFEELQFRAALGILSENPGRLLDDYDVRLAASLRELATAYDAWDKFEHLQFMAPYWRADFSLPELAPFRLAHDVPARVQKVGASLTPKDGRGRPTPDVLADLWNNAKRRLGEGRDDDATARLYRLTEMLAQYDLGRRNVNTANVQVEQLRVSDDLRRSLEAEHDPGDGRVKIGLKLSYRLLEELGSELGRAYAQRSRLQELLKERNASILAHGTTPVKHENAEKLAAEVAALAGTVVPDFAERCAQLQFPWLA